jgi:acyl carrier protein
LATEQSKALEILTTFLQRANKRSDDLAPETRLYGDGLQLDSLEAAELSALLEDELGSDPFSAGEQLPETVGEILAFYEVASTA